MVKAASASRPSGRGFWDGLLDKDVRPPYRLPLLFLGFVSLFLGLAAGVVRLGWQLPLPRAELVLLHGPLMASGFFGTLISLERAVALGKRWAYAGPALAALGAAALIGGAPVHAGALLMTLGSLGLLAASAAVFRIQQAAFTATLLLGAASWFVGNVLWLTGWSIYEVVPWWAGFLVLTIAGERLELSRFMPPSAAANQLFMGILVVLVAALVLMDWRARLGQHLLAAAFLALTAWLLRYDIARQTIKSRGVTRFIGICLLSAYGWLAVGALIGLFHGGMFGQSAYGATLHTVFLGFVFSMVFGHAPIILPAVTRFAVHYHPVFYVHLLLLHLSLVVRVIGDVAGIPEWKSAGGLVNAVTLIIFVLNTAAGVWRGRRQAGQQAMEAASRMS